MLTMRIIWIVVVACFVAAWFAAAVAPPWGDVVGVEGSPFKARLQAISAEGVVSWERRGEETKKMPLADL